MAFSVVRQGRGGHITFKHNRRSASLGIEMTRDGEFIVFFGDMSNDDAAAIEPPLVAWLNATGKESWVLDTSQVGT